MQGTSPLDNVSIVLVRTKTPGNIGAVARCMMNMGLSRLVLVRPPKDPQEDAMRLAAGAAEIIAGARTCETLQEAVADQHLVIGTSRRRSRLRKNIRTPRSLAEEIAPLLASNRISIVFGREVNGLRTSDLALCREIVVIPSSPVFASLNLSHAVMVVAYELFVASRTSATAPRPDLADSAEMERLFDHLQQTLERIGFLDRARPGRVMFALRQLLGRARPEQRDVSILRGILTEIDRNRGTNSE